MRILHTSDWHLGKRLENLSRFDEQRDVLTEICRIADSEKADVVLIAGDLFDTFNPPAEAVDLFYKTLKRLSSNGKRAVIAIAGNHDSPDRIEAPDPLARECGIIFSGYPNTEIPSFELDSGLKVLSSGQGFLELKLPGNDFPLRILLTPYANEYRLKTAFGKENSEEELRNILEESWKKLAEKHCDTNGVNILVSHLFMVGKGEELPEEPADEKPILHVGGVQAVFTENIPEQIQYTALGHLHRMHNAAKNTTPAYYSGSPLSYSFAEANQKKYVILVDAEPDREVRTREIELKEGKKMLRYRAEGMEEALNWLKNNQNCWVELTMVTETYLTALERKQLAAAHPGIAGIIPEVTKTEGGEDIEKSSIDLTKNIHSLFADYFSYSKGQEPNAELMDLFSEVLSENEPG